ncbi:protein-disulfide reductase DsbD [Marinobacter sp. M1N3S26]|uniref:protein-disulfide reductase DsbD n=1 Tax=Marinobacter sp. M1N3S26 TaxID=3382299 RepID=UPI00387B9C40
MPLISRFPADLLRLFLLTLATLLSASTGWASFNSNSLGGQDFLPVDEALPFSFTNTESGVLLSWDIAPDHYLYRGRIAVSTLTEGVSVSEPAFSLPGVETEDPYFGTVNVFYEPVEARVDLDLPEGVREATLEVTYQGCAKAGLCYPPQTREVLFYASQDQSKEPAAAGSGPTGGATTTTPDGNLDSATGLAGFLSEQSLAIIALVFLALGLGLTFTPCVLPMVPIISTLVSSQNTRSTGQALALALSYVLGMALTYAAAGVITGLLGASFNLQAHLQSPWVLGSFAALFVLFALAMFNIFDLQLPQGIQNRLSQASQNLSGGRVASVFGIGALSALVVSPCVSAPLAGSLLYISTTQDAVVGGVALLSLGLGMGIPLILVAVGGRHLLPTTGSWMNVVKAFYGVMLLAVAIWLLERLVPAWLALTLWGVLAAITGVQLGAFDQARAGWQRTWKGAGLVLFAWGLALLAGALSGASNPMRPLAPFMASSASSSGATATEHAPFERLEDPDAIRTRLDQASAQGQPVILDFYADWCISCKIMEREVFSKPGVIAAMAPYTLLQIDMTDNTPSQQALLDELGLFGPPAILFYDGNGQEQADLRVLGEMDLAQFREHLERASSMLQGVSGQQQVAAD